MKNFSCFARVIFIVLSWFVFGSLSFGQTMRFRHLKLVHSTSDIRKDKKYVLISEVDGEAYVLVGSEDVKQTTLVSFALSDFYGNVTPSLLSFIYKGSSYSNSCNIKVENNYIVIKSSGHLRLSKYDLGNDFMFKLYSCNGCFKVKEYIKNSNAGCCVGLSQNKMFFQMYSSQNHAYLYEYTPTENVGSVTIPTAEGYGTYYLDKAFVMPEGLEGSTISDANHATGELSLGWEYKAGDVVPAGTALLLKGTYNKKYELFAPEEENVSCSSVATLGASRNYLRGSVVDAVTSAPDGEDVKNYLFYKMYYLKEVDGGESKRQLGFFWGESSGGVFTSSAKRAYMALPRIMANKMKGFALPDAGSTSVQHPVWSSSETNETVYRLDGKKFNSSSRTSNSSGIYIIGGKKVILK